MQLWTWQNPELVIYDEGAKYDSLKYSSYLNDEYIAESERNCFLKAYKKLGNILEGDQLLWCYTDQNEAVSEASVLEYEDKKMWELDVPEKEVRIVCSIAWHWILRDCESSLGRFDSLYIGLKGKLPHLTREEFSIAFHRYWKTKDVDQLWEVLFCEDAKACWDGCPQAIVSFPVKEEWVV